MSTPSEGGVASSSSEGEGLEKRQHDLTHELAIHIIQIVTRNKATNPSNPSNDVMIQLMRSLLEYEQRTNGVCKFVLWCDGAGAVVDSFPASPSLASELFLAHPLPSRQLLHRSRDPSVLSD